MYLRLQKALRSYYVATPAPAGVAAKVARDISPLAWRIERQQQLQCDIVRAAIARQQGRRRP
jgi:hypothetical protein